jgi:superfamily II DNA or RNA helicase
MVNPFRPRDWQERFVREYQNDTIKNFLLESCTSAGKTGGAIYAYTFLKDGLDWQLLLGVTPSEHLRRQYAQDAANLFGLNLYYSGTSTRLGRLPTPKELLKQGYHGLVISYQWLATRDNAERLKISLEASLAGKIFLILDEVHHVSEKCAFGKACEIAFPDHVVSHRLMTSGTPFRSDNNKILGNWVKYKTVGEGVYECIPDFRYTLADALRDKVIPPFSFVTLAGEFTYRRGVAHYEGKTFTNAQNEQELTDALNTAIYVKGDWVKTAIEWSHGRMKRDRANGLPECATYIRVPTIKDAQKMKERIRSLTNEDALVVVSKEDEPDFNSSTLQNQDSSKLIEDFAAETGYGAKSWIIGVGMLGEGVSIKRLKYRIHATNIRAPLTFIQDLGRLLRMFPDEENPEPVETLIPAHPDLIKLALKVMDEVAHVVREREAEDVTDNNSEGSQETDETTINSSFQPIASTGEFTTQIVEGEEISDGYTRVAEWALMNHPIGKGWKQTPAHLAQILQSDSALFEVLKQQYELTITSKNINPNVYSSQDVPSGFPSEYANWLADEKTKYASKEAHTKAQRLAYLLYPKALKDKQIDKEQEIKKNIQIIHTKAKEQNGISPQSFIGYEGWEKIYLWLLDKIAHKSEIESTEDL